MSELLRVTGLRVHFRLSHSVADLVRHAPRRQVRAVNGVDGEPRGDRSLAPT